MDRIENFITYILHVLAGLFCLGLIPAVLVMSLAERIGIPELEYVVIAICLLWILYVYLWSKRAAKIYQHETLYLKEAWLKARVFLHTDILTKLAFIPLIGLFFDRWINRNNPDQGDDRP